MGGVDVFRTVIHSDAINIYTRCGYADFLYQENGTCCPPPPHANEIFVSKMGVEERQDFRADASILFIYYF